MTAEATASRNAVLGPELAIAPARVHDFALVIGVDYYPLFRDLKGAVGDAQRFHEWVCSPHGGGVSPDRARMVVSTKEPIAPVQDQIDEALLALVDAAAQVGGGRRLYFYFSGHGATDEAQPPDNVALLLAMWSLRRARVALSSAQYSGELAGSGLFEEIAAFLDCCRSTTPGVVGLPPTLRLQDPTWIPCSTRTFIAFASEARRPAFELPVEEKWEGVFTRCLLGILTSSPGGIAADALKKRLELEVPTVRPGQRAVVRNEFGDASWFGQRAVDGNDGATTHSQHGTLPELRITFRRAQGTVRLQDGGFNDIASHAVTAEPWVLPLPPGLYLLSDGSLEQSVKHLPGVASDVDF